MAPEAILIAAYFLIAGLMVGSFLNVVIYRFPIYLNNGWRKNCIEFLDEQSDEDSSHNEKPRCPECKKSVSISKLFKSKKEDKKSSIFNIAYPPSHCPKCKAKIKAWQNIPILSYILLKGKCHSCEAKISIRYPIVEAVTGLLTLFVYLQFGLSYQTAVALLFTWSLISLTMIDVDHLILPDDITLPLMWLGLLANTFGLFTDLNSAVIGAIAGYLSLYSVYWAFKLITGKEGMGYGDFKLLAALGAFMGWQSLPVIIILSSFVGAIIGIGGILLKGNGRDQQIPFGPYLAIAGWIAFFYSDVIITQYLSFFKAA